MSLKCKAIVQVTLEVTVEDMSSGWTMYTVAEEAKGRALRRVKEVCTPLGKVAVARVTAVMTEEE